MTKNVHILPKCEKNQAESGFMHCSLMANASIIIAVRYNDCNGIGFRTRGNFADWMIYFPFRPQSEFRPKSFHAFLEDLNQCHQGLLQTIHSFYSKSRFCCASGTFLCQSNYTKVFYSNCEQILNFLRICSHLLMKLLTENFIFCYTISTVF